VKADISREMELEELKKLQQSMQDAARSIEQSVHTGVSKTEAQLNEVAAATTELKPASSPVTAPDRVASQLELGLDPSNSTARKQA
jgi:sec-independent protein translocase protein TatB